MDDADGVRRARRIQVKNPGLILPDLSYQIVGALYDVYNEIGFGHREYVYQRAVAEAFRDRRIDFIEQYAVPLVFHEKRIGDYRLDFLIDKKVILELKQGNKFLPTNIKQTLGYLKALDIRLGILANFTKDGVLFRRVVNDHGKTPE
jgi:GxxExxY protein